MSRSTARSSIVIALVGFLCLPPPARASSQSGGADAPRASALRIYGAYLPNRVQWEDARWGFGFATRTTLNPRLSLDVGAARFASSSRSVTPMTVGFAYGPASQHGARPWAEFGAGYYRLESTASTIVRVIPTLAYYDAEQSRPTSHRNLVGGYFGVGFDIPLSGRFALGTGVRMHAWSDPDALIALQTGISYGF